MLDRLYTDMIKHPELKSDFSWYDMTREEKMKHWWQKMNVLAKIDRKFYFDEADPDTFGYWQYMHLGNMPVTVHFSMFYGTIRFLADEKQAARILPQAQSMAMLGCYA